MVMISSKKITTILFVIDHLHERSDANVRIDLLLAKQLAKKNQVTAFVPIRGGGDIFPPYAELFDKVYAKSIASTQEWYKQFARVTSWPSLRRNEKIRVAVKHPFAVARIFLNKRLDYLKNRKALFQAIRESNADAVIVTGSNWENVQMLFSLKKRQEKRILIELDPYTLNEVMPARNRKKRWGEERRWLFQADAVFVSRHFSEQVRTDVCPEAAKKIIDIELPGIVVEEEYETNQMGEDINFVFAGGFYEVIRRPEYLLQMFTRLPENYHLYLYSIGCAEVVNSFAEKYPGRIIHREMVSLEELKKVYSKMDVLVNVSNTIQNQLPSKLIEEIGTAKPIVNFCKSDTDISIEILQKYRNHITLIEDIRLLEENCRQLCEFVKQTDQLKEGRESVLENYSCYTDQYVAGQIETVLKKWEEGKQKI